MELNKKNMKKVMMLIAFTVLLFVGLQNFNVIIDTFFWITGILLPFFVGGAIAFILSVPMKVFEEKLFRKGKTKNRFLIKATRPLSIFLSILLVLGIICIVSFMIVPEIGSTVTSLANTFPGFVEDVQNKVMELIDKYPEVGQYVSGLDFDWTKISSTVLDISKNFFSGLFTQTFSIIGSIVSTVTTFLIGFVFAVYLLANKEKLAVQGKKMCYSFLPEKKADRLLTILQLTHKSFSNFLSGQCVEAVIEGFMFFVVLSIFRFPYAVLIGVLVAFTALIPIFGAFIGCIIGTFLIVIVNPIQAVWFIILFLILQQVESNLIYPYVVGGSIGLPSIWVLFAVTVGGSLMGIVGMLAFIPLFSVFYTLLRENVKIRLLVRRIAPEKYNEPLQIPIDRERKSLEERRQARKEKKEEKREEKKSKSDKTAEYNLAEPTSNNNASANSIKVQSVPQKNKKLSKKKEEAAENERLIYSEGLTLQDVIGKKSNTSDTKEGKNLVRISDKDE